MLTIASGLILRLVTLVRRQDGTFHPWVKHPAAAPYSVERLQSDGAAMEANVAVPAALIADPARAAILLALLDGRAQPATSLAYAAGISSQSASNHLSKLVAGGLLRVRAQGRHRYYGLANGDIAQVLEGLSRSSLAGTFARSRSRCSSSGSAGETASTSGLRSRGLPPPPGRSSGGTRPCAGNCWMMWRRSSRCLHPAAGRKARRRDHHPPQTGRLRQRPRLRRRTPAAARPP